MTRKETKWNEEPTTGGKLIYIELPSRHDCSSHRVYDTSYPSMPYGHAMRNDNAVRRNIHHGDNSGVGTARITYTHTQLFR